MNCRGMTLLEVMVALGIFAITGMAVMKSATDHLSAINQIEEVTFATWVANNRMAQLQLEQQWPPKDNQRGSQELSERTWYWQQKVVKTNDKHLLQVEVTVGLDPDYEGGVTTVTTYLAHPRPRF